MQHRGQPDIVSVHQITDLCRVQDAVVDLHSGIRQLERSIIFIGASPIAVHPVESVRPFPGSVFRLAADPGADAVVIRVSGTGEIRCCCSGRYVKAGQVPERLTECEITVQHGRHYSDTQHHTHRPRNCLLRGRFRAEAAPAFFISQDQQGTHCQFRRRQQVIDIHSPQDGQNCDTCIKDSRHYYQSLLLQRRKAADLRDCK